HSAMRRNDQHGRVRPLDRAHPVIPAVNFEARKLGIRAVLVPVSLPGHNLSYGSQQLRATTSRHHRGCDTPTPKARGTTEGHDNRTARETANYRARYVPRGYPPSAVRSSIRSRERAERPG